MRVSGISKLMVDDMSNDLRRGGTMTQLVRARILTIKSSLISPHVKMEVHVFGKVITEY